MVTKTEFCPRHGYGEFFLAIEDHDTGSESLHCPECHPELFAEYQAADAEVEARQAVHERITKATTGLVEAARRASECERHPFLADALEELDAATSARTWS